MRVAILSLGVLPFATGGVQVHTYYQAKHLREMGVEVSILTRKTERDGRRAEADVERVGFSVPLVGQLSFILASLKRLMSRRPDVVHVHYATYFAVPAYLSNILMGTPYVVSCHGYDVSTLSRNPLWRAAQMKFFKRAAAVTAPSRDLCLVLERIYGLREGKLKVVPNGIEYSEIREALASSSSREGPRKVVFLGNLRPVKDPIAAVDAFKAIADEHDVRLVMIGGGELLGKVKKHVKELGLERTVILEGELPHRAALREMASCDVMLLTSKEEGGNPLALMEAMAMGIPAVAGDVGGVRDVITDHLNGILVPPGSPLMAAKALQEVLDDPSLYKALSRAAKTASEEHGWEEVARKYLAIYAVATEGRIRVEARSAHP